MGTRPRLLEALHHGTSTLVESDLRRDRGARGRVLALALVSCALTAACGSTVPGGVDASTAGARGAAGVNDGALGTGAAAGDRSIGNSSLTSPPSERARSSESGSKGSLAVAGGRSAQQSGAVATRSGPNRASLPDPSSTGVAGTGPVKIGLFVLKDVGSATKSLGAKDLASGNGRRQALTAVKLLNSRGGLAGRKVEPVVFEYDATQNASTQFQAACSLFFDDNKIRALVATAFFAPLAACTEQRGVPYVTSGNRTTTTTEFQRNRLLVASAQFSIERVVPLQVQSLKAQRWLTATSKIGLLFNADPDYSAVPDLVAKQLKAQGLPAYLAQQAMPSTDDTSRAPQAANAGQNAALRFASLGVDRVVVVDKVGSSLVYFGLAAQNQNYYPAFGLTSLESPNLLRTFLSQRSLENARGIGWLPGVDLPTERQPALNANYSACLGAMKAAGEDMSSSLTRLLALSTCDGVLLLGASWTDATLSTDQFLGGLKRLGTSYASVPTFRTDFRTRRDGASQFRPLAFDARCDCFDYTAAATTAP